MLSNGWQIWKPTEENKVTTKEKLTAVVRIIETRLESNEKETRDLENQMIEEIEKIDEKIDQINSNLDDIENKNTKMDQRFRMVLYHFWSTLRQLSFNWYCNYFKIWYII